MIWMATSKMKIFLSSCQGIVTSGAIRWCSEGMKLLEEISYKYSLKAMVNELGSYIENIDGMWEVTEYVYESFSHFASHVEVVVLSL